MSAKLVLEDKSVFYGASFGASRSVAGEVVFNTSMVGYPEAMTDPSYRGQILVLTYPLVGNYGVPSDEKDELGLLKNFESDKIQISGLIISDYSYKHSHWSSVRSLADWMKKQNIPGIAGVDTRALTKKLREKGVMLGKMVIEGKIDFEDPNKRNLAAEVSVREKVVYNESGKKKVVLVDCGAKNNIIRSLAQRGCCVIRVPWDYNFLEEEFDGLMVSNGPGDPKMCDAAIKNVAATMKKGIPTFGICLGNQIVGLAAGCDTYKLKYGHRSQNQPCTDMETKRCYITTQNHGFAVDARKMPSGWEEWFRNENDGTNEGLRHKTKPFMSVQFHPEATPGPVDTAFLFDRFVGMMK
ncbi:glutamine-hydrolyzing carbamoyl-phosphate synthase small subunit [Candidatus Woesearchaeota archaeon]|nr:glutamine-hydrolyzing carbamoyl-phosphate synthase small subunit [Candidatus Woesearchaeota archaeon]